MAKIEYGKELKLENVLSLRKKMAQSEIQSEMMKIGKLLEEKQVKKNGPVVTTTFSMEQVNGQPLLDMEIFVPMDRKVDIDGEYRVKEVFHLLNAVYARHEGNPNLLQNTYNEMIKYVQDNGLQQITGGYNVNVKDLKPGDSIEDMVMDVYIGVSPNKL